jgi:sugar lactone lactonase YvrE
MVLCAGAAAGQSVHDYVLQPAIGSGSRGDGGPAVNALLDGPAGLAEDSGGNIYISESKAGLIRRVRPDGVIERFAGTGRIRNGAEGQVALETDLLRPTVLAMAADGGLLFADPGACRIRKVLTDGTIRDLAGIVGCGGSMGGPPGFGGGSSATAARRALDAQLGVVGGMVVDGLGRLVFSDETYHVVRRLDADGYIRVIAGAGAAGFGGDDGDATKAYLRSPRGLAYDDAGNLFVADSGNCRVRRINASDGLITTVAGTSTCATASRTFAGGTATRTSLGRLAGLAWEKETGTLLIASPGQARLLRLDPASGRISSVLGDGRRRAADTSSPQEYSIDEPDAVLVSPRAGILVADTSSFAVVQLLGGRAVPWAGFWPQLDTYPSAATATLVRPRGLCIDSQHALLVVDAGAERVLSFRPPDQLVPLAGLRSPTGYSSGNNGPAIQAQIGGPNRVACAPNGDVFLTQGDQTIRVIRDGTIGAAVTYVRTSSGVDSLSDPAGLAVDPSGQVVFSEAGAHRVGRYDLTTRTFTVIAGTGTAGFKGDGGAATDARLDTPGDLAFDSKGNLLIADRGNRRIRRVSPSGIIETIAGSDGSFSYTDISGELATNVGLGSIDGMAVDAADNIYISEYARVSVIGAEDGRIRILTGLVGEDDGGNRSYIDGPLNGCDGLAIDRDGRLYFSVREEGRVLVAVPKGLAGPAEVVTNRHNR